MALNAAQCSMTEGMKTVSAGTQNFEALALPVATRKGMGVIAMKVFGQEQLVGAAKPEELLGYALSLPISLASVGMPKPELIAANAEWARGFKPMSRRQRQRLTESITTERKHAWARFIGDHLDA